MALTQVASILPPGETTYTDGNGVPLAGGSVYYYIPNTTTPKITYSDPYAQTPNSNPVILDGDGRCVVYGEGSYEQFVYDVNGNLIYSALTADLLSLFALPATTRIALSAPANFYVATTGNDSNNGTISSPWLTIQRAISYIAQFLDLRGFSATINVSDGTYTGGVVVSGPFVGQGVVQLLGDTSAPGNCIISTTSADAIQVNNGGNLYVEGFKLQTATSGNCLSVLHGGQVYLNGVMNFGACAGNHIQATGSGSFIEVSANYTISGAAVIHWLANTDASIFVHSSLTITITGTPAFGTAFADAYDCGVIVCKTLTFSGSATGTRYTVTNNGVIDSGTTSPTYFPGSSNGTATAGGIYGGSLSSSPGVPGGFSHLKAIWISNTEATITANWLVVASASGGGSLLNSVNQTVNTGTSGAGGLDTGVIADSTWYNTFIIYNGTTVSSLLSLSATAPTLPGGYTQFAKVGTVRVNNSGNLIGFIQVGNYTQYVVGNNLAALPQMFSGSAGDPAAPTWTAGAWAAFAPPTIASMVLGLFTALGGSAAIIVAPNNNYGAYTSVSNPAPLFLDSGLYASLLSTIVPESSNIYYASNEADTGVFVLGYTDNL